MTHVHNGAETFKADIIRGFALAHADRVTRIEGASGFRRADGPLAGKTAVVIGGGSGHFPSYNGVVGPGFADGCVLGDIFASPSAEQVYRVAKATDGGAGVILGFGNYAGDRLNFGLAASRLRSEGIDTRIVYVTDDIASADADHAEQRRGIAGTFTVYKLAGAAAEEGFDLDQVEAAMRKANEATYSFGVAFAGCTLPGADEPLFVVEEGKIDFGLGIHGEPGISTVDWMPAKELAAQLVERILAERPADSGPRVAVVVNGLGATKYEELYVLFGEIAELLIEQGLELVEPEVGELVTSLDMAGCSLSVTWLDEDLERWWTAPADTPAFKRGTAAKSKFETATTTGSTEAAAEADSSSEESRQAAVVVRAALDALDEVVHANQEKLGRLDAIAGDGDHGIGMSRGSAAARAAAQTADGGVQSVLQSAGAAFGDKAGGTSGVLWGLLLAGIGEALGNSEAPDAAAVSRAVQQSTAKLQEFSGAGLGDKTMIDALLPFVEELDRQTAAGAGLAPAWRAAAEVAVAAAQETAQLVPRLGRARPLAERSVGTPDPGAVSLGMIVTAVGEAFERGDED